MEVLLIIIFFGHSCFDGLIVVLAKINFNVSFIDESGKQKFEHKRLKTFNMSKCNIFFVIVFKICYLGQNNELKLAKCLC